MFFMMKTAYARFSVLSRHAATHTDVIAGGQENARYLDLPG